MRSVRMSGVQIDGKNVSGVEVFKDELGQVEKFEVESNVGSLHRRDPFPGWVFTAGLGPLWPFTFTIADLRKWWRFGIVSEELVLMQCTSCRKSFTIMREYGKNDIFCPYCKAGARPVTDCETYLTAMCRHILKRDGKGYVEKRS